MSDEETLRRLAREAITAQRLPIGPPKDTWGGNGAGALCDICGLSIATHELGFEVEFPREGAASRIYHLHSLCFAAWELERHVLEAERPRQRSNGRSPPEGGHPPASGSRPAPATESHRLSGTAKAGSMPHRERKIKDGGESS